MSQTVDARGMACPLPVINTKKVLEGFPEGSEITTIVDNEAAKDNVVALASGMGYETDIRFEANDYYVRIIKKGNGCGSDQNDSKGSKVILISAAELGRGSAELGVILMKSFMFTVFESDDLPTSVLFINSGVYLTCVDSPVIDYLVDLDKRGVEMLSCGTCLDYYKLKDRLRVGQITNMYTILEKMNKADKVITL